MANRGTGRQVTLDMLKKRRDEVAAQLLEVDKQLEKAGVDVRRSRGNVSSDDVVKSFIDDLYKTGGLFPGDMTPNPYDRMLK